MPSPSEFNLIETYFRPLSEGYDGAFGLLDDAALIGDGRVVTTDCLISGVHFIETATPGQIARKTMGANLSDLAAMGAVPDCYTLALALTDQQDDRWLKAFTDELHAIQQEFGVKLIGGDTVSTPGPLTLSITAFGKGTPIRRNGARIGDTVYVSGSLGDGALGLLAERNELPLLVDNYQSILKDRYHRPRPRLSLGEWLQGRGHALADISDGLVADLGHICKASSVGAIIQADRIPLSMAAMAALEHYPQHYPLILSGGDDYELVLTGPDNLDREWQGEDFPLTPIGSIVEGQGVEVLDQRGQTVKLKSNGYSHR